MRKKKEDEEVIEIQDNFNYDLIEEMIEECTIENINECEVDDNGD